MSKELIHIGEKEIQVFSISKGDEIKDFLTDNINYLFSDKKENTQKAYKSRVSFFIHFLKDKDFNFNILDQYKLFIESSDKIEHSTKSIYFHAATEIVKRLNHYRPDLLPDFIYQRMTNLLEGIPYPQEHIKDGLNSDEVNEVKAYLNNIKDGYKRTRLKAMFVLMCFQGLRQFEVAKIHTRDLNLRDGKLKIYGKGGAFSNIFLYESTIDVLDQYLRFNAIKDGYLFTSNSKNKNGGEHLTERSIRRIWRNILDGLNIDKVTHGFRHWYVTENAEKTGDIFKVKRAGRFKSLETPKKYIDTKDKKEDLEIMQNVFKI